MIYLFPILLSFLTFSNLHAKISFTETLGEKVVRIFHEKSYYPLQEDEIRDLENMTSIEELPRLQKIIDRLNQNLQEKHYRLLSPQESKDFNIEAGEEKNCGLGLVIAFKNHPPIIEKVLATGPAQKAGILAGDKIWQVNGVSSKQLVAENRLIESIRGEEGTSAQISVKRKGKIKNFNITRECFYLPDFEFSYEVKKNKLVFKMNDRYSRHTAEEMKKVIENHPKTKHIIIDLSKSSGGHLDAIKETTALFAHENNLLISYEKMENTQIQHIEEHAKQKGPFADKKLTVILSKDKKSYSNLMAIYLKNVGARIHQIPKSIKFHFSKIEEIEAGYSLKYIHGEVLTPSNL